MDKFKCLLLLVLICMFAIKTHALVKKYSFGEIYENMLIMHDDGKQHYFVGTMVNNAKVVLWNSTFDVIREMETSSPNYPNYVLQKVKPQYDAPSMCYISARQDSVSLKYFLLRTCLAQPYSTVIFDSVSDDPIITFYFDFYSSSLVLVTTKGILRVYGNGPNRNVSFKEIPELSNGQAQLTKLQVKFKSTLALYTSTNIYTFSISGAFFVTKVNMLVNSQQFFTLTSDATTYLTTIQQYKENVYGWTMYELFDFSRAKYSTPIVDSTNTPIDMTQCSNILVSNASIFFLCEFKNTMAYVFNLDQSKGLILNKEMIVPGECSHTITKVNSELVAACNRGLFIFNAEDEFNMRLGGPVMIPLSIYSPLFGVGKMKYIASNKNQDLYVEYIESWSVRK